MECTTQQSLKQCSCTYMSCERRGNCCKCVSFHNHRGEFPGCFFSPAGERRHDRSLASLMRDRGLL